MLRLNVAGDMPFFVVVLKGGTAPEKIWKKIKIEHNLYLS